MKKAILSFLFLTSVTSSVFAYDTSVASVLNNFYGKMDFKKLSENTLSMKPNDFIEKLKKDEKLTIIDIRTTQEKNFIKFSYHGVLDMPLNELFSQENLAKLPSDRLIIVVCHSGTRALPAAIGLKMIGFQNVKVLDQGIVELAQISSPATLPFSE